MSELDHFSCMRAISKEVRAYACPQESICQAGGGAGAKSFNIPEQDCASASLLKLLLGAW